MKLFITMALSLGTLSTFAATDSFSCKFEYFIKNGESKVDVISSKGQQSTKVNGYVSTISSALVASESSKSSVEKQYYVNLYRAIPGIGLRNLMSEVITEKQVIVAQDLYSAVIHSGHDDDVINVFCSKD